MTPQSFSLEGNLIDLFAQQIYPAKIQIIAQKIAQIEPLTHTDSSHFILPGLIDAHVHIESSMLTPTEFARLAVVHGTVATVSDPHEIANVLGIRGVEFMIKNGKQVPFKFFFGAPSCVPATIYETAGAEINTEEIETLLKMPEIKYLAEMMNYPGVLNQYPVVMEKLAIAQKYQKVIDGHAPGLRGELAKQYIAAGISTDHECFTAEEALDKLLYGMKIIVREGSAAKNFEALAQLIPEYFRQMMFCSDDKHPDDLLEGHIDSLVKRALAKGYDLFKVLQMACINPVEHYDLEVGLLRVGDWADFIVIDNPLNFKVLQTYINGELVAQNGQSLLPHLKSTHPNHFTISAQQPSDFAISAQTTKIRVIKALDGELITQSFVQPIEPLNGMVVADNQQDILKMAVVNRYHARAPVWAFVQNFGIQGGAIASSVAHDSHNIIAVGDSDEAICEAVNLLIEAQGGIVAVVGEQKILLPLPIAGLMTDEDGYEVARQYIKLDQLTKKMGSKLRAPFMTLSFMALLVIPELKLSDLGLFDGQNFRFVDLFVK
ncbi:MAG: adenine deaminase [Microscillaceae bacterium]|jgi:adenine deaminase|nr:adenine deaminase [Microscillaceae bacterium]